MKRNKILLVAGAVTLMSWLGCKHSENKNEGRAAYPYQEQNYAEAGGRNVAAADFSIPSGTYGSYYGSGYYSQDDRVNPNNLRFKADRGVLEVDDRKNGIVYTLNMNTEKEQAINPAVLQKLRIGKSAVIGNLIQNITVFNVNSPSDGHLNARFNLYLRNSTPFGDLSARMVIGTSVTRTTCKARKQRKGVVDYSKPGGYEKILDTTCLKVLTATEVSLASIQTGLPKNLNAAVGLAIDTVLKIMSPTFASEKDYINYL